MDIATGLSALKTSTDLLRSLREKLKSGDVKGEEVIGRIDEIYDYIVESKDSLIDVKDEIHELKEKLRAAEEKLHASDDLDAFVKSVTYCEADGTWRRMVGGTIPLKCTVWHASMKASELDSRAIKNSTIASSTAGDSHAKTAARFSRSTRLDSGIQEHADTSSLRALVRATKSSKACGWWNTLHINPPCASLQLLRGKLAARCDSQRDFIC